MLFSHSSRASILIECMNSLKMIVALPETRAPLNGDLNPPLDSLSHFVSAYFFLVVMIAAGDLSLESPVTIITKNAISRLTQRGENPFALEL